MVLHAPCCSYRTGLRTGPKTRRRTLRKKVRHPGQHLPFERSPRCAPATVLHRPELRFALRRGVGRKGYPTTRYASTRAMPHATSASPGQTCARRSRNKVLLKDLATTGLGDVLEIPTCPRPRHDAPRSPSFGQCGRQQDCGPYIMRTAATRPHKCLGGTTISRTSSLASMASVSKKGHPVDCALPLRNCRSFPSPT